MCCSWRPPSSPSTSAQAGRFLSAAFAGAIVGAASTVALVGRRRLTPSLAGGASLFGAPIGLVAIAPSAVSAPVLFAAAGAGRSVGDVSGRTLLQRISPNDVLSRVFGVLEGLTMLALVIGSVGAAILIEAYGVQAALVVVGAFLPVVILLSGDALSIDRSAEAPDAERLRLLRDIPFFAPLPAPAMERVLADMFPIEVPDGAVLIREGDPGDLFYVIVEGRVEITRGGEHVSEQGPRTSARSHCCATSEDGLGDRDDALAPPRARTRAVPARGDRAPGEPRSCTRRGRDPDALGPERQRGRQREAERDRETDGLVAIRGLEGFGDHLVREHREDRARGERLDGGDPRSGRAFSATYRSPAASVLAATTTTQSRSTFRLDHPSRMRSLDAAIDSGTLDRKTATITATLADRR